MEVFRGSYNKMRVKCFRSKRKRIKSTKYQFTWLSSQKIWAYISFQEVVVALPPLQIYQPEPERIFVLSMRRIDDSNSAIGQLVTPKVLLSVLLI